jgi:dienelactone hydrolase
MPRLNPIKEHAQSRLLRVLVIVFVFLIPTPLVAANDGKTWLAWNRPADRSLCPDQPTFVWVEHERGKECIRYFPGDDIRNAPVVIAQFYGDRDRVMRKPVDQIRNNTRSSQEGYAARQTRRAGIPVVVIARPGTYGSSGDHRQRRQPKEYHSLNAALDRIKARYGIQQFVLSGHSGGATAAAALLTLGRTDIRCATLSSGAYDLLKRAEMLRKAQGRRPRTGFDTTGLADPYDPLDHVQNIPHDPERLVIILGNPEDSITPFSLQLAFANALEDAGHRVRVDMHPAREPAFHNLTGHVTIKTAGECAKSSYE